MRKSGIIDKNQVKQIRATEEKIIDVLKEAQDNRGHYSDPRKTMSLRKIQRKTKIEMKTLRKRLSLMVNDKKILELAGPNRRRLFFVTGSNIHPRAIPRSTRTRVDDLSFTFKKSKKFSNIDKEIRKTFRRLCELDPKNASYYINPIDDYPNLSYKDRLKVKQDLVKKLKISTA